jgi:hypothetical protein
MMSQQSESHEEHEVREHAKRWIARFAPLLDKVDTLEVAELHQKLTMLQQLREEGATLLPLLPTLWSFDDFEIVDAVNSASQQIPSIESELRRQLSLVSPGDPLGEVNLEALQEKLSEREARQELGLDNSQPVPFVLEEVSSPPNPSTGTAIGLFGLGWTLFTTFHCIMMVGGMFKAFGPIAFLLLAFYSFFFMVGYTTLRTAFLAFSAESIQLDRRTLTVTRKTGPFVSEKVIELAPDTIPAIESVSNSNAYRGVMSSSRQGSNEQIKMTDVHGNEVSIAGFATRESREKLCKKISQYLAVRG